MLKFKVYKLLFSKNLNKIFIKISKKKNNNAFLIV